VRHCFLMEDCAHTTATVAWQVQTQVVVTTAPVHDNSVHRVSHPATPHGASCQSPQHARTAPLPEAMTLHDATLPPSVAFTPMRPPHLPARQRRHMLSTTTTTTAAARGGQVIPSASAPPSATSRPEMKVRSKSKLAKPVDAHPLPRRHKSSRRSNHGAVSARPPPPPVPTRDASTNSGSVAAKTLSRKGKKMRKHKRGKGEVAAPARTLRATATVSRRRATPSAAPPQPPSRHRHSGSSQVGVAPPPVNARARRRTKAGPPVQAKQAEQQQRLPLKSNSTRRVQARRAYPSSLPSWPQAALRRSRERGCHLCHPKALLPLLRVFSFLDRHSLLLGAAQVCAQWHAAATHKTVLGQLLQVSVPPSEVDVRAYLFTALREQCKHRASASTKAGTGCESNVCVWSVLLWCGTGGVEQRDGRRA